MTQRTLGNILHEARTGIDIWELIANKYRSDFLVV